MAKCGRKGRYTTKQAAERFRASMVARGLWNLPTSNTYRCNYCGGFHAGRVGRVNRGRR
jgi:hypothetical protein